MPNHKKTVCVFDFDGTLVDSMDSFIVLAAEVMRDIYQLPVSQGSEAYVKTSGIPFREQLEIIFPGDCRNPLACQRFESIKKASYLEKEFCEDVGETIGYLQSKKIKVVVSSSNYQELVEEFLKKKKVRLDLVLGWRPNFSKGRDHFRHVQKVLSVTPQSILFVGDSLKDAERAEECSIDFIAKTGIFSEKEFRDHFPKVRVIRSLSELKSYL
ncbi:MAG: HAD family hydrolase [Deltaproteobacteria bacterium]|nr:HAD family hydrolase [Deltaproteobacteria bacterium]